MAPPTEPARIARNASPVLASDVINRATTFLIYILVARYLGAFEFGQLSLALTLLFVLQAFAGAGLRALITREVARGRSLSAGYLANGSVLVLMLSVVSVLFLVALAAAMNYRASTTAVVLLLALGLVPYGLSTVADGIFQGWERMHLIAIANVPAHLAKLGVAAALLAGGRGLYAVVGALVGTHVVVVVIKWWLLAREGAWQPSEFSAKACRRLGRRTLPFAGVQGAVGLRVGAQVIVLSALASEVEIGLYSSTVQLLVPFLIVAMAIERAVFPRLSVVFQKDRRQFARVAGKLNEALLTLMLPAAIGLFFLGDRLLAFVYGSSFTSPNFLIQLLAWVLICRAFTASLGRTLLAGGLEVTSFRIAAINLALSFGLGVALVQVLGLKGAALAGLVAAAVNVVQHAVPALRLAGRDVISLGIWRPVVAAAAMVVFLTFFEGEAFAAAVVGAIGVYAVTLAAAVTVSSRRPRRALALSLGEWSRGTGGPS